MEKVLSISIAAYNLGNLLCECLDSFAQCVNKELLEVIVTDDGSADNTLELAREYEIKYPGVFKVIAKINEGPGSTVNSGIRNATGKYFKMVDGDDMVITKNLDEYLLYLKEVDDDLIITDYSEYDNVSKSIMKNHTYDIKSKTTLDFNNIWDQLLMQMHSLTYKTNILQANNIILDNGFYTDIEYALYPLPYVKNVSYFPKVIYVYRLGQEEQSVNPKQQLKHLDQHTEVLNNLLQYIKDNNLFDFEHLSCYKNRVGLMLLSEIRLLLCLPNSDETKNKIIDYVRYCKNDKIYYKNIKKSRSIRLLINSNFLLYNFIGNALKRKFGLQ